MIFIFIFITEEDLLKLRREIIIIRGDGVRRNGKDNSAELQRDKRERLNEQENSAEGDTESGADCCR